MDKPNGLSIFVGALFMNQTSAASVSNIQAKTALGSEVWNIDERSGAELAYEVAQQAVQSYAEGSNRFQLWLIQ